jgi:putative chitinase
MNIVAADLQLDQFTGIDSTALKPLLDAACTAYGITTPLRVAHFLAQLYAESGDFQRLVENLNYSAPRLMAVWPRHFPDMDTANRYAHNPEALGNFIYANRMGNGDEASGDGFNYRGRGLIMSTGRDQYQGLTDALNFDFVGNPDALAEMNWACIAAAWTWNEKGCNALADADDIEGVTRAINGGLTGLADRQAALDKAIAIWSPA